jgi:hypothetical protein
MYTTIDGLAHDLLQLPQSARANLAKVLIESLDEIEEPDVEAVEAAWIEEVQRRLAEARAGNVEWISAEEALRRVREKIGC